MSSDNITILGLRLYLRTFFESRTEKHESEIYGDYLCSEFYRDHEDDTTTARFCHSLLLLYVEEMVRSFKQFQP